MTYDAIDKPSIAGCDQTNLCHNALDRHLPLLSDHPALIFAPPRTHRKLTISYGQLFIEVQRMAAILRNLGVGLGDSVLIHMPKSPTTVVAMLATARLGATHTVVLKRLGHNALVKLINDEQPKVAVTGYQSVLSKALAQGPFQVEHVLLIKQKLSTQALLSPREIDYHQARTEVMDDIVPCAWVDPDQAVSSQPPDCFTGDAVYSLLLEGMSALIDGDWHEAQAQQASNPVDWVARHAAYAANDEPDQKSGCSPATIAPVSWVSTGDK
ncbi:MAG: AMP-binding protein [Aquabacterium sp.]|nr:AMP-binding protein [Aquabacterium sp.]